MTKMKSLSLFVGKGECNAKCRHCAGIPLRKYSPSIDGIIDENLIAETAKECHSKGARNLSLSGSGEPTLSPISVTKTLKLIDSLRNNGVSFSRINLYSNGIRTGNDETFCRDYLGLWKEYGLSFVYVTVHDTDEKKNADAYGIESYPPINKIVSRIHNYGMMIRGNIVLSSEKIGNLSGFKKIAIGLIDLGFDYISAWPVRGMDDRPDRKLSPPESELDRIEQWIETKPGLESRIRLMREKNRDNYEEGQKLTLFPDGTLSGTWCNY